VTSFLLSGPKIGLILDPYWAYQNLRQLEMGHPKFPRKEDVLYYLITVGSFIMVGHFPLRRPIHTSPHLVYLPS